MLKTIGCAMILCAGGAARQMFVQRFLREEERLRSCIAAVGQMELEVRLALTPMTAMMGKLAHTGGMADYFACVNSSLQGGHTLREAWERALPCLRLGAEAEAVMRTLGQRLNGDESSVCRALTAAERALEELYLRRHDEWREQRRLSAALCFSGAVLTIIVLL